MRTLIFVFPEAMKPGQDSIWESPPEGLRQITHQGEVFRLAPVGRNFESELMGLSADIEIARGPLIVSAFGWEPPSRSVHFELSLLSVDEDGRVGVVDEIKGKEARILEEQFLRLQTKKITPKWGEQSTHGLVWEDGSIDLGCKTADEIIGSDWTKNLPEGDGEVKLRTLIDDSLNLLDGLEMNVRRFDEGKPKANLLWPHSFGFRPNLPFLPLRRGESARFFSDEIGIEGIVKMVGYEHYDRHAYRKGIHVHPGVLRANTCDPGQYVFVDQNIGKTLEIGRGEEALHALENFDSNAWDQFAIDLVDGSAISGAILCPSATGDGMGLLFGRGVEANTIPFDVRAWDDRRLRNLRFSEVMANLLGG
jgi:hypothetical protein